MNRRDRLQQIKRIDAQTRTTGVCSTPLVIEMNRNAVEEVYLQLIRNETNPQDHLDDPYERPVDTYFPELR